MAAEHEETCKISYPVTGIKCKGKHECLENLRKESESTFIDSDIESIYSESDSDDIHEKFCLGYYPFIGIECSGKPKCSENFSKEELEIKKVQELICGYFDCESTINISDQDTYDFFLIITSIKFSNIFKSVDNCEKIINRLSLMMLRMYNCLKKEYKETIKNLSLLECHYRADLYNFFTIRSHISDSLRTYLNDTIYPGLLNKLEILYPQLIFIKDSEGFIISSPDNDEILSKKSLLRIPNEKNRLLMQHISFEEFPKYYTLINSTILEIKNHIEIEKNAYKMYWIFANLAPYKRGSAGASKVLLNSILFGNGFHMVKEREEYKRLADWMTFFCDFEDFYTRKDIIFERIKKGLFKFKSKTKSKTKSKKSKTKSKKSKTKSKTKTKSKKSKTKLKKST